MTALVLLPGMDGSGELFAGLLSHLCADIRPIVVSYPVNQALGYDELVDFARTFLPANEPFVLLGESFSGPVAISLAAARPAGLVGLILSCTYSRNPLPWFQPLKGLIGVLPVTSRLTALVAPLLFGRFASPTLRGSLRKALDRVPASTIRARMRAALEVDCSERLKEIQIPILYLQASNDHVVPASASRELVKQAKCIEVVQCKGPHLLLQVLPAETAKVIENFIHRTAKTLDTTVNNADATQIHTAITCTRNTP